VSPEKGGALRNQSTGGRRLGVAAVICGVLFGAPLLLLQSTSASPSRVLTAARTAHDTHIAHAIGAHESRGVAGGAGVKLRSHLVSYRAPASSTTTSSTTTTTAPALTTTTDPAPAPTTTSTAPPPPPPTTTTTMAPPMPTHSEEGDATWYAEAPDGYCASPTLPFGTELTVTNDDTGASTTCTVDDREDAGYPRVVDMSPEGFSQIANTSEGVVEVTISW
jgi:hypothetical protein